MGFLFYLLSIGLSDAIEYKLNPLVHRIHNAPDIMNKSWYEYNTFDAFMSGIKCSWLLTFLAFFTFYVFGLKPKYLYVISVINLFIPIMCYVTGWQFDDMFLSHKLLYGLGFGYFLISVIINIIYKLYKLHL